MNFMHEYSRHQLLLLFQYIVIAIIPIVITILLGQSYPERFWANDTISYIAVGERFLTKPSLETFVNVDRPPFYSIFIASIYRLAHAEPHHYENYIGQGEFIIIVLQTITNVVSCLLAFSLLRKLFSSRVAFIGGIIFALDYFVIAWNRYLLTESSSLLWMTIFCYVSYVLLQKVTLKKIVGFVLLAITGLLLRSAFLTIIVFPLVLAVWITKKKHIRALLISATILLIFFPLAYKRLNKQFHHVDTIQYAQQMNILGVILKKNIPLGDQVSTSFGTFITNVRGISTNPYVVISMWDPTYYQDSQTLAILEEFTTHVVRSEFIPYVTSAIQSYPVSFTTVPEVISLYSKNDSMSRILVTLQQWTLIWHEVLVALSAPLLICVPSLLREKKHVIIVLFVLIFYVTSLSITILSDSEYARLFVESTLPMLILSMSNIIFMRNLFKQLLHQS